MGFVFDRSVGILPAASLNASSDPHDAALARLLAAPTEGASCAPMQIDSIYQRSMF